MIELAATIRTRLLSDAPLVALVTGGIWNREIRPPGNAGATPGAYAAASPGGVLRLRPTIAVQDRNEFRAPRGHGHNARIAYVRIDMHVPADDAGKRRMQQIDARLMTLLHGQFIPATSGDDIVRAGYVRVLNLIGPFDDDVNQGAKFAYREIAFETAYGRLSA